MFDLKLLVPAYGAEIDAKSKSYARGRKETIEALKTFNQDLLMSGIGFYQDAFNGGVIEAGVNILAVSVCAAIDNALKLAAINDKRKNKVKANICQQPIEVYASLLENAKHPAGIYYLALALIYGFYESGIPKAINDSDSVMGWDLMVTLVERSNEYALNFAEFSIDFWRKRVPLAEGEGIWIQPPPIQTWGSLIYKIW